MKPTLLILAAGMGSRYGGLKQIDGIGPNNEPIIEYSIYDAIKAGFGKIVFVIREEFDAAFREIFDAFNNRIEIEYVYQPVNFEVEGLSLVERTKPWGTSHAVLVAKDVINEPFAVNEREKLARQGEKVEYNIGSDEPSGEVDPKSYVSMNYWGFHPSIFKDIEEGLHNFMKENSNSPTAEYYIPNIVSDKIKAGEIAFAVIPTNDNWFGVTYKEDKQMAIETLNKHIENGVYPKSLWS